MMDREWQSRHGLVCESCGQGFDSLQLLDEHRWNNKHCSELLECRAMTPNQQTDREAMVGKLVQTFADNPDVTMGVVADSLLSMGFTRANSTTTSVNGNIETKLPGGFLRPWGMYNRIKFLLQEGRGDEVVRQLTDWTNGIVDHFTRAGSGVNKRVISEEVFKLVEDFLVSKAEELCECDVDSDDGGKTGRIIQCSSCKARGTLSLLRSSSIGSGFEVKP
jgi:hypothetical protein